MLDGRLVAIDGVDGCGKSSQIKLLVARLRKEYPSLKIMVTREPWDVDHNVIGKRIRQTMMQGKNRRVWADEEELNHESLQYLFFLDRCVHYMKLIMPALEDGYLVITDRERMVTYSYGLAAGVKTSTVQKWHQGMHVPDIYYFIRVSASTALSRIKNRNESAGQDYEIFETKERVEKNVEGFDVISKRELISNLVKIDGDQPIDDIAEKLYDDLVSRLDGWLDKFAAKQEVLFK